MTGRTGAPAKARAPLNRQQVLAAAISFADHSGIEALSMRKLGRELGVEAMALYNHVADKDDMLDGMVDIVWSEVALPPDGSDWKAAIRTTAGSAHRILLRHPWAGELAIASGRAFPARLRYIDAVCGRLRTAGLPADLIYHGYHAIDSHIIGSTMWYRGHSISDQKRAARAETSRPSVVRQPPDLSVYPDLAEHAEQHRTGIGRNGTDGFSFVLDLLLDGLDRARGED